MKFVFSYRGAGARVILAETCQLVHFPTPFFLAAQRRTASAVKKKLPKENPWKGFLWTLPETEGQRPLWHPGLPDTDDCTS